MNAAILLVENVWNQLTEAHNSQKMLSNDYFTFSSCFCLSGAHTYSYLFNMKTRIPGFPRWVEAEHAEDLQYLFGKPFSTPLVYFPRHRDLSGFMIAYWTNFAKTG